MKIVALALLPVLASLALNADSPRVASSPVMLPAAKLKSLGGQLVELSKFRGKPLVLVTTSATCPVCKKYGPTLAKFEAANPDVNIVYLNPTEHESGKEMRDMATTNGLRAPYLLDPKGSLAAQLAIRSTAEVFVFDANMTLKYRGAFDNQYGVTTTKSEATQTYVADALRAIRAGEEPALRTTEAPGCVLDFSEVKTPEEKPVYTREIARIVNEKCVTCHRDGGVAPFSLTSYEAVKGRAGMIKHVIENKIMPPWFADDKPSLDSKWKDEKALTEAQLATFTKWLASDKPKGDAADMPAAPKFDKNWKIGKPDLLVQIPEAIAVKADGFMDYQYRTVTADVPEDRWIAGLEIKPTDRSVVHHVLVFLETPNQDRKNPLLQELQDAKSFFAGYVPGQDHVIYPTGFAKFLPKGSKFRFQIHYTPNGKATNDQVQLGLKFATGEVKNEVKTNAMLRFNFAIPPHAEKHEVVAENRLGVDGYLMAFMPHMHVRGSAARYELEGAAGFEKVLNIPRYDFNWQLRYELKQPIRVTPRSRMRFTAWYDNSEKNAANPDPNATVRWGDQTYEEMMLGYFEYYTPRS
ncbi:MAG: redoxin domain-containing protein [Chthonomonas sp.]|nr:redoxin domain-containing protein [Chthonomonas sp.]